MGLPVARPDHGDITGEAQLVAGSLVDQHRPVVGDQHRRWRGRLRRASGIGLGAATIPPPGLGGPDRNRPSVSPLLSVTAPDPPDAGHADASWHLPAGRDLPGGRAPRTDPHPNAARPPVPVRCHRGLGRIPARAALRAGPPGTKPNVQGVFEVRRQCGRGRGAACRGAPRPL